MRLDPEPAPPTIIAYLQTRTGKLWRVGYLSRQPAEEQVEAAPEALRLRSNPIISGSVSRPAPEVQRLRSRFRGTSAGEGVKHKWPNT
jgi:hypothetical protein